MTTHRFPYFEAFKSSVASSTKLHPNNMPTIGKTPSLEATQAVGAILLHQFVQQAGIDENLIREAEDRAHLDELAAAVLHDEDPNVTSTSMVNDMTANNTSVRSDGTQDCSGLSGTSLNGSSIIQTGEENFHSISESVANNTNIQDRTVYHSINDASNRSVSAFDRLQSSPNLASYGKELRRIAEEFEKTRHRQEVRDSACRVNLSSITKEEFVKLLEELFQEKITREKIVILFFFCTDVALRAASYAHELVIKLLGWSFSYIINTVCSFIHKLGGWDKVLFYQLPSILITCCAALAIASFVVYLRKNLRDP